MKLAANLIINGSGFGVNNAGTTEFTGDFNLNNIGGSGNSIVSSGTISKTGGSGTALISVVGGNTLNLSGGVMAIGGGTLQIGGGGAVSGSGTLNVSGPGALDFNSSATLSGLAMAAGSTTRFSAGTQTFSGSVNAAAGSTVNFNGGSTGFTGAYTGGTTNIAGGTVDFGGATTLDTLALSAGTLTGAGTVNVTSSFSQTGGTQAGSGSTVLGAATALELGGASFLRAIISNGNTTLSGGVFTLNPAVAFTTGRFDWTNGDIAGSGVLITAGATTISGAAPKSTASGVAWNNTGNATLSGGLLTAVGQFTNPGSLTITDTLQLEQNFINTGTLAVNGVLRAGAAVNAFVNDGRLLGTGSIDMGGGAPAIKLTNNGTVAPGVSPGTLTIIGDYEQSSLGTLQIELAGLAQGVSYDWLNVTGNASIAGTLQVSIPGGFLPTTSDAFRFVTAGQTRSGTFASVVPPPGYGGGAIYGNTFTDLGFTQLPPPVNAGSLNTFSDTLALVAAEQSLLGNLPKQQLQFLDQGLRPEEARRRDELVMLSDGCQ